MLISIHKFKFTMVFEEFKLNERFKNRPRIILNIIHLHRFRNKVWNLVNQREWQQGSIHNNFNECHLIYFCFLMYICSQYSFDHQVRCFFICYKLPKLVLICLDIWKKFFYIALTVFFSIILEQFWLYYHWVLLNISKNFIIFDLF